MCSESAGWSGEVVARAGFSKLLKEEDIPLRHQFSSMLTDFNILDTLGSCYRGIKFEHALVLHVAFVVSLFLRNDIQTRWLFSFWVSLYV